MPVIQFDLAAPKKPRTIVLAIDPERSEEAKRTVQWAVSNFLDVERDKVELICAFSLDTEEDATDLATDTIYVGEYLVKLEEELYIKNSQILDQYADALRKLKFDVSVTVLTGPHADSQSLVVDHIEKVKGDVLLLASRNLGTWQRFFFGSFSDFCVHHCRCPVVVIH